MSESFARLESDFEQSLGANRLRGSTGPDTLAYVEASEMARKGDYLGARRRLDQLPDSLPFIHVLGLSWGHSAGLVSLGKLESEVTDVVTRFPALVVPRFVLGRCLLERGDIDGAAEIAGSLRHDYPANSRSDLLLAAIAIHQRRWLEATVHFEEAIAKNVPLSLGTWRGVFHSAIRARNVELASTAYSTICEEKGTKPFPNGAALWSLAIPAVLLSAMAAVGGFLTATPSLVAILSVVVCAYWIIGRVIVASPALFAARMVFALSFLWGSYYWIAIRG